MRNAHVLATLHLTFAAIVASVLSALAMAGLYTLVGAYRPSPDDEPPSAARLWGGGLLGVAAIGLAGYLLDEAWLLAAGLGSFVAATIEHYRRPHR